MTRKMKPELGASTSAHGEESVTPERIVQMLRAQGTSMSEVARVVGKSPVSVRRVIYGESKSRFIANTIAAFLEVPVDTLWPGAYPDRYTRSAPNVLARLHRALQIASARKPAQAEEVV
jgi:lambda repressor-like predicted transcriptional regulator